MLSILLSWIIIFVVFYSFGKMALIMCQKLFQEDVNYDLGNYNCLDVLLIGVCAVIIPLQLWSLFLPSNHVFLALCITTSLVFCLLNRQIVGEKFGRIKSVMTTLSWIQLMILFLFVIIAFWGTLWLEGNFDSEYYHYPAIRWNVEYPIIPGLANLEDRFAFNSTYLLLSAVFSFQYLWGEPVYGLQSFFYVVIVLWILVSLFRSKGDVKSIILFASAILFSVLYAMNLVNTSTDVLPNLIFFYLIANMLLSPESLHKKKILFFVLPFLIVTLKISLAPIGFIACYILYVLYKQKLTKEAAAMLFVSSLIVILWLIRNVILSGYLVYPLHEIDIFSFDWKLPKEIAMLQKQYIYDYPMSVWKQTLEAPFLRQSRPVWLNFLSLGTVGLIVITLPLSAFYVISQMRKSKNVAALLVLVCTLLTVILGVSNGFDLRFICGALVGLLMLAGIALCDLLQIKKSKWLTYSFVALFFLSYGFWTLTFGRDRFAAMQENYKNLNDRNVSSVLVTPFPAYEYMRRMNYISLDSTITVDKIDDKFDIYVSSIVFGMNHFPLTYRVGEAHHGTLVDYNCLKARGNTIQEGFRMDTVCMHQSLKLVKEALDAKGY